MGKLRSSNIVKKKTSSSIIKLRIVLVVEKLQKSLLYLANNTSSPRGRNSPHADVKEGHFAVIAEEDGEKEKFLVPLSYLAHPSFLKLLEGAAEEYGFDRDGVLTIPCRPCKLERILSEQWRVEEERGRGVGEKWDSCKTMLESSY